MVVFYQFLNFLYFHVDDVFVAVRSIICSNMYDNIVAIVVAIVVVVLVLALGGDVATIIVGTN